MRTSKDSEHSRSLIRNFTGRILRTQKCNVYIHTDNNYSYPIAQMRKLIWVFNERTYQKVHFFLRCGSKCFAHKFGTRRQKKSLTWNVNYVLFWWGVRRSFNRHDFWKPFVDDWSRFAFLKDLYIAKFFITKTCLDNFDPLKPHFYIVKLGFTGVHIIFLIFAPKHRLWVHVRTASPRRF